MPNHQRFQQYLFGWEDPDTMREYRQTHRSMAMTDKTMSLTDAVRGFVKPGAYMVFGGLGSVRNPMAAVYEIIRQNIGGFTIGTKGSQHDWQLLAAAGLVASLEVSYGFADEIRGLSMPARRAVENGTIRVLSEYTNAAFQWRFKAAMMGLPFLPTRSALGTATVAHSGMVEITDPFSGKPIGLLPACYPDVAIIHVHRADAYGNAQIDGNVAEDIEVAHASKRVIITTERLVDHALIRERPERTTIPYFVVDAVVEMPFGAHPNNMPYLYSYDEDQWQRWLDASLTEAGVAAYFERFVRHHDHWAYLEEVGGLKRLRILERIEQGLEPYPPVARRR